MYENSLVIELRAKGFQVEPQKPIKVYYKQNLVGEYTADMVVNELILLELKARRALIRDDEAQLLNYLKATPYEVGLLFNFGPIPKHLRKAYDNENKLNLKREK